MGSYGILHKMVRVIVGIYEGFEWAMIDGCQTSDRFKIKWGVKKQECVMSGFLFLLAMDWIMRKTTADKRRGMQWNLTTMLDIDFADDITLLPFKFNDLGEKSGSLMEEAAGVGLKLNARKCKSLRTEFAQNRENTVVTGEEVEDVKEFVYLKAIVDKEGGGSKKNQEQTAEGTRCIPEAMESVGSQRNRKGNQDTTIQDFSPTSPAIWL